MILERRSRIIHQDKLALEYSKVGDIHIWKDYSFDITTSKIVFCVILKLYFMVVNKILLF